MKIVSANYERSATDFLPVFMDLNNHNPYMLIIEIPDESTGLVTRHMIDLSEPGWMSEKPEILQGKSEWILCARTGQGIFDYVGVLAMSVLEGEEPYYAKRHIGVMYGGKGEIVIHGIGKKARDGAMHRMWILPNGIVVPSDDCDVIVSRILKQMNT